MATKRTAKPASGPRGRLQRNHSHRERDIISPPPKGADLTDETAEKKALVEQEGENGALPIPVRRRLPREVQNRIVVLFAQFHRLSQVKRAILDEFGLDMDERDLGHYDASKPSARVGRRLRELFAAAREAYIGETANVAISHQNHRLRLIEKLIDKAETAKEFDVALKGLRLAAEEMGGGLTKERVIKHEGAIEHRHLSVEDARAELAMRLSAVIDGGSLQPIPIEDKSLENKDNPEI